MSKIKDTNRKISGFSNSFLCYFSRVINGIIEQIKNSDKEHPHFFSYLLFSIILIGIALGIRIGSQVVYSTNIPPREMAYVAAAIIAGLIGLLVSETNKESEIGKHREKWLEEGKKKVSEYASVCTEYSYFSYKTISDFIEHNGKKDLKLLSSNNKLIDRIIKISCHHFSLTLYFKVKDETKEERKVYEEIDKIRKSSIDILQAIEGYKNDGEDFLIKKKQEASRLNRKINKLAVVFKKYNEDEWMKIKKGHVWYRVKRCVIFFFITFSISIFSSYAYYHYEVDGEVEVRNAVGVVLEEQGIGGHGDQVMTGRW